MAKRPVLTRGWPADLEVRGDGRTVVGIACPFDAPTEIRDGSGRYLERFKRGAFATTHAFALTRQPPRHSTDHLAQPRPCASWWVTSQQSNPYFLRDIVHRSRVPQQQGG